MSKNLSRKTRSGRTFLEVLAEDNPSDLAVLQLGFAVDMDDLARKAVEAANTAELEEPQVFASTPLCTPLPPPPPNPLKHSRAPATNDGLTEPASKRACTSNANETPKTQSSNNRRRKKRRTEKREVHGHPRGSGRAFEKHVLTSVPIESDLQGKELPIAEGGWIATNASYYGAKAKRTLEEMKAKGFTHIPWQGKVPVCAVDQQNRVMLVAVGRPDDPSYVADAEQMAELMMEMGANTDWDKDEKHHKRGNFAYANYGWSYGKGQPRPQRLGGERQEMMREFVEKPCTQRIAAFQSASFALWFPKSYAEFCKRNSQLQEKIPAFDGNIKGSVYSCCTANCTNTWTHIHRDGMNSAGACCAITSGGPFDPTKGGQLIIWDLKLIFDFPPGSTILLPSALFRHSNIPVQEGDKRVSFTQYTAGGIHRWLEYGGRTEDELAEQDPEGFEQMLKERPERWRKALDMFSTIDNLKAGVIS